MAEPWQLYIIMPFFVMSNRFVQAYLTAIVSKSAGNEIQGVCLHCFTTKMLFLAKVVR